MPFIYDGFMTRAIVLILVLTSSLAYADVKSTTGQIKFDTQMDNQAEMTLNSTGLGIGTTPSTNLHVNGNAIVTGQFFVGGSSGSSNLNIHGSMGYGFQTVSSNTTLDASSAVLVDSSSDNIAITLPYAGNVTGRQYTIKKINTSNSVWINGGGNLIDDTVTIELPEANSLGSVELISDGQQWFKIAQKNISETIAESNLIGWWKLDETSSGGNVATDSSGQSLDGTVYNFASSNIGVNGKVAKALDFDGDNNYVDMGDITDLDGLTQMSVSVWIYLRSAPTGLHSVISKANYGGVATNMFFIFVRDTQGLRADCSDGTNMTTISTGAGNHPTVGAWTHIAFTLDTTDTLKLYSNATLLNSHTNAAFTSLVNVASSLRIGSSASGAEAYFDGLIDDVRIYNRALTSSEVQALYNQGQ